MIFTIQSILYLILNQFATTLTEFDYKNPDAWSILYPQCDGRRQSPIDIDINYVDINKKDGHLTFSNYRELPKNVELSNNGHTLKLNFQWFKNIPHVHGRALKGDYQLDSIHLHWNHNKKTGSEHRIQGRSFSLEMHLVHFKSKYKTFDNAAKSNDGLLVIAILFELSITHDKTFLSDILYKAPQVITKTQSKIIIEHFSLESVIKTVGMYQKYAMYSGSLTTPPCTENVIWIVSLQPLPISETELEMLDSLQLYHNDQHNNRPLQPVNNRKINIIYAIEDEHEKK